MKFGDLVMSVASMAVIFALIVFPLDFVFVSVLGFGGYEAGVFVSFFLSALIGGYIFAGKIWEARRENIMKITVLRARNCCLHTGTRLFFFIARPLLLVTDTIRSNHHYYGQLAIKATNNR